MWYEKNNLVVRTWILDFSRSICDEIDIIPWILRLIICCLANNRNLPRARVGGSKSSVSFYGLFGLILAELEQMHEHRQRSQQIYSSKHRWRASKKKSQEIFFLWNNEVRLNFLGVLLWKNEVLLKCTCANQTQCFAPIFTLYSVFRHFVLRKKKTGFELSSSTTLKNSKWCL